jgi:hypothetical protein
MKNLQTFKLIAYNGKISTNNIIKLKSLKCQNLRICNVDVQLLMNLQ